MAQRPCCARRAPSSSLLRPYTSWRRDRLLHRSEQYTAFPIRDADTRPPQPRQGGRLALATNNRVASLFLTHWSEQASEQNRAFDLRWWTTPHWRQGGGSFCKASCRLMARARSLQTREQKMERGSLRCIGPPHCRHGMHRFYHYARLKLIIPLDDQTTVKVPLTTLLAPPK
jgi:hypothetical protein